LLKSILNFQANRNRFLQSFINHASDFAPFISWAMSFW